MASSSNQMRTINFFTFPPYFHFECNFSFLNDKKTDPVISREVNAFYYAGFSVHLIRKHLFRRPLA